MSTSDTAANFVKDSQDYLDGKTTAHQALAKLTEEVHQAYGESHKVDPMINSAYDQADGWNAKPEFQTHCDGYSLCSLDITKSGLDWSGDSDKKITLTSDRFKHTTDITIGHMVNGKFVAEAMGSFHDDYYDKQKERLIFSDPTFDLGNRVKPGETVIAGVASVDRMAIDDPRGCAKITKLALTEGDGIALHNLNAFSNVTQLNLQIRLSDADLKYLPENGAKVESLTLGDMSYNVNGPGLADISKMSHLKSLDLAATYLGGAELEHLTSPTVTSLNMGDNMKNEGFRALAKMPHLEQLQLNSGNFTMEGLQKLAASSSLKHLVLNYPHDINDADVQKLQKLMPNVKIEANLYSQDKT